VKGSLAHLGPRPSMEAGTCERQAVLGDPNAGPFKRARARADLEQMERHLKEYEAAHPGEAIDRSKITVAGEATREAKDSVPRSAAKVDSDGSPCIVLESIPKRCQSMGARRSHHVARPQGAFGTRFLRPRRSRPAPAAPVSAAAPGSGTTTTPRPAVSSTHARRT
jgi:hypothetical protein